MDDPKVVLTEYVNGGSSEMIEETLPATDAPASPPLATTPDAPKKSLFKGGIFGSNWGGYLMSLGGLGIALFILFVLWMALVPNSAGHTRLELIWETLRGKTRLNTNAAPSSIGGLPVPNTGSKTVNEFIIGAEQGVSNIEHQVIDITHYLGGIIGGGGLP